MTQERRRAAPSEKDHGVEPVGAGSCRPGTSAITAGPDHLEPAPTGTVGETEIWPSRPGAPPGHWKREGTIEEPSARPKTCGDMPRCGWAITNPSARPKIWRRLFARWRRRPLPQGHIRASSAARRISLLCPGANIHIIDFLKQHPFESAKREEYAHRHRLGE